MKFVRKCAPYVVALAAGAMLAVVLACVYVAYKGRETVSVLLSPPGSLPSTEVYARWVEWQPGTRFNAHYLERYLEGLPYKLVATVQSPGEYSIQGRRASVYARGFRYPDKEFPAQKLTFTFSQEGLEKLEGGNGERLDSWRLEPWPLAQWNANATAGRPRIRLSELPPYVPGAVVAVEDKRFFSHPGFDAIGILRAIGVDLRHGAMRQGASTISQQLARSVFLDTRRTLRRKILEAALTLYLEIRFTKPQLLEMYLNQVYWGQDGGQPILGIESASRAYFGKASRTLTVAESALLAGLLHSPNRLAPRRNPVAAIDRRKVVLSRMEQQRLISKVVRMQASREPLKLAKTVSRRSDADYFLEALREDLDQRYSLGPLLSQGWRIFTTIDPVMQRAAVEAVKPPVGQAALVAIEPGVGAIRAYVGGTDFAAAPFDRARMAKRQAGSAFKPFVYLAALESRQASPATMLEDKPVRLKGFEGQDWSPQNYDKKFKGQVLLRSALIHSLNVPTVLLAQKMGWPMIASVAQRAGIQSPLRNDLSSALGASEMTVLEVANAYATLAASGQRAEAYSVESIVSADGAAVETHVRRTETAFEAGPVYLLTRILQAVFDEGTAKSVRQQKFSWKVAGKTGTSENFTDAWLAGYTPEIACVVWVGYDLPQSLGRSAAGIALPIWKNFMARVFTGMPPSDWERPDNVVEKTIDPQSGAIVRSGCPTRLSVEFVKGTEPQTDCPLHTGGLVGFFKRLTSKTTEQPKL